MPRTIARAFVNCIAPPFGVSRIVRQDVEIAQQWQKRRNQTSRDDSPVFQQLGALPENDGNQRWNDKATVSMCASEMPQSNANPTSNLPAICSGSFPMRCANVDRGRQSPMSGAIALLYCSLVVA